MVVVVVLWILELFSTQAKINCRVHVLVHMH